MKDWTFLKVGAFIIGALLIIFMFINDMNSMVIMTCGPSERLKKVSPLFVGKPGYVFEVYGYDEEYGGSWHVTSHHSLEEELALKRMCRDE